MKEKSNKNKVKIQQHSPSPQPERAIYGFFLLIFSVLLFIVYISLAFISDSFLINKIGWDYLPDKYWTVALPAIFVIIFLTVTPSYIFFNMTKVCDLSSINNIKDEHSIFNSKSKNDQISTESIDPIYDIPLVEMNQYLFL
jgi:Mn2+/Fe2+ NRAMP family transporter